jgi:hypothetical protein
VGIVEVTFLFIVEDLVCLFCGFEPDFGFDALLFCDLVGVVC